MVAVARSVQACRHGFYYAAVGVIIFERPYEGATQAARHTSTHITCLQPDSDGIVIGPKGFRVGVVKPNRNSLVIKMTSEPGEAVESEVGNHPGSLQVVCRGKGSWAGGGLVKAVMGAGNASPAASIGGNTEYELLGRHASAEVGANGVVDEEIFVADRILRVVEQRRSVVGRALPRSVKIVSLDVVVVELLGNFGQLDVGKVLLARRTEHGEEVVFFVCFAQYVELPTEFLQEESGVLCVGGGREFPIDVDAVENARGGNARGKIAVDEEIDAVRDHGLAACGSACGSGETGSAGKRNQNLQIRMKLLQLLERGKVAVERTRVRGATDARKVGGLIIGPGVSNGTPGRGGITEA